MPSSSAGRYLGKAWGWGFTRGGLVPAGQMSGELASLRARQEQEQEWWADRGQGEPGPSWVVSAAF